MGTTLPTYSQGSSDKSGGYERLRARLKVKHSELKKALSQKHPDVDKFFQEKGLDPGKIREHSTKVLGAGALAGALLLTPPSVTKALPSPHEVVEKLKKPQPFSSDTPQGIIVDSISSLLPDKPRPLSRNEEKFLEQIFENVIGVKTRATLEGEHLNTTYGYIGIEQHLRRYPGDNLIQHGTGQVLNEGIAPGLGAWGYFAPSKDEMTSALFETERWYAAVQTLYLPDWRKRQPYLRDWYKYRKVLIVDVDNGNAVVAAIADAGPAAWTGKQFGASPEVMEYLGGSQFKKGRAVLFFVDDPENKVPLGPVDYTKVNLGEIALK
jgi:hypothetical protein